MSVSNFSVQENSTGNSISKHASPTSPQNSQTTPPPVANSTIHLNDKYEVVRGRIFMNGTQALVRMLMFQRMRDAAAGLSTAGFVSGYRGSPLGGVDQTLWQAQAYLQQHRIHFSPGINEDLAATAVWGSQQVTQDPKARVDGVFALWYGKGPGVDRSLDVIKHGNAAGTSKHGGVVLVVGDDHACKSSTFPHQSEPALISAFVPILNPSGVREFIEFGLHAWALSRYSGCWIAFKAISDTVESTASFNIDPLALQIITPNATLSIEGATDNVSLRWPDTPVAQEQRLLEIRLPAALAYARANQLNRITLDSPQPQLTLVTTGKSYLDTLQALDILEIDTARAASLGIRLLKIGMSWPLDPEIIRQAVQGVHELLVIEEKRPIIEDQIKQLLYGQVHQPRIVGKQDEQQRPLLAIHGELSAADIALVIAQRLQHLHANLDLQERCQQLRDAKENFQRLLNQFSIQTQRLPTFCSGCPHNTSTKLPAGSRGLAGIGCHYMVMWMDRNTGMFTQMGGEGVTWIGQAPFTNTEHVFVNLGDGTYFHSGLLAIRAAVAAKVNLTYKILFNDAVAMTGGQAVDGVLTVPQVAQQIAAEGVQQIVLVSDAPEKYEADALFPPNLSIRHRDDLDAIQRHLRTQTGVTAIIYDQTCAAEKRRRRKRHLYPEAKQRIVINEHVCEGCGDCSRESHCVSIVPLETELGRKRAIDQSSCNSDFSCLKGFCPSFVSVTAGTKQHTASQTNSPQQSTLAGLQAPSNLPEPNTSFLLDKPYNILVTGVGGTGIVTIGAIVGMAAHLDGKGALMLDMAGLAQKGGAVKSHIRIGPNAESLHAARIVEGDADLLLACDLVVASTPECLSRLNITKTRAVINRDITPTSQFLDQPDWQPQTSDMLELVHQACAGRVETVSATTLATRLLGDSLATNLFMLGFAWQKGWVPLQRTALEQAIRMNGAAVEMNLQAFHWGRQAACNLHSIEQLIAPIKQSLANHEAMHTQQQAQQSKQKIQPMHFIAKPHQTLEALLQDRQTRLTDYQNAAYGQQYRDTIERITQRLRQLKLDDRLATIAAKQLYRLMAYKDEYEVARLYTHTDFLTKLKQQFGNDCQVQLHLAPPLFAKQDPITGHLKKRVYGQWVISAFRVLAALRSLRGHWMDPFGYTAERKNERALITEYRQLLEQLTSTLAAHPHPSIYEQAIQIAQLPEQIRGYGHIKEAAIQQYRQRLAEHLAHYTNALEQPLQTTSQQGIDPLHQPDTTHSSHQSSHKVSHV